MHTNQPRSSRRAAFVLRTSALALAAVASSAALLAQQASSDVAPAQPLLMAAATPAPLDLATTSGVNYSSSSSSLDDAIDPVAAERLNLTDAGDDSLQPPPRRRYGRPRYNDSHHNADGSNKYGFLAGVGVTLPLGNTSKYLNTSYGFQVGGGRNFNKNFSLMLQFDYDAFGFTGQTLYNQSVLYDPTDANGFIGNLDGKSHVWSLTINPVYNFLSREKLGAYVVGGVGFYHKTANFTIPTTGEEDFFGEIIEFQANQTVDKYTSNAPGFNGGVGITYKPSRFAGERLYVEARYVFIDNSQKQGLTLANENSAFGLAYTGNNFFPANSNRTTYIPIKAGIRF